MSQNTEKAGLIAPKANWDQHGNWRWCNYCTSSVSQFIEYLHGATVISQCKRIHPHGRKSRNKCLTGGRSKNANADILSQAYILGNITHKWCVRRNTKKYKLNLRSITVILHIVWYHNPDDGDRSDQWNRGLSERIHAAVRARISHVIECISHVPIR